MTHEYGKPLIGMALGDQRLFTGADSHWEASWEPSVPEATATLWRYMSFAKFCSLLERKELFFSLVGDMEDRYEGFIYPPIPREHGDRLQQAEHRGSRRAAQDRADRLDKLLDGIRPRVQPHVGDLRRRGRSSGPYHLPAFAGVNSLSCQKKWTPKPGQRLKWNLHRVSGRRAEAGCAEVHHIWRPPTK